VTARILSSAHAPVRQSSLRAHNLALVLRQVTNSADPPSRAAIASATGLTRATVSALVDELIAGGLVTERDPAPRAGAGRPAAGLVLAPDGPAGLGLEINVDYLAACVVDLSGTVRHRIVEHGDQRPAGPATALDRLAGLARRALAATDAPVAGAALAVPGLVGADGVVRVAPNLGWQDVDAAARLGAALGRPVTVDNEANLAALSELRTAGTRDFIYVSGQIGIGAGIVLGGTLYRGIRGWSGEIGHLTVHPDGPVCRCGARGCLEQYAGLEALGDLHRGSALDEPASALGIALAAVINLLDVDTVVLGGAYGPLLPRLRGPIEAELRRRVLTADLAPITLRAAALGADAAMRGAADSVIRAVQDDPAAYLGRAGRA
jgi:predicted NBD/HSP70 family sugar kinase